MSLAILRRAFKEKIAKNPFTLSSANLYPLIDNGYGEMIEDRDDTPESKSYDNPVRISTKKSWTMDKNNRQTPVSIEVLVYYMVSDWETIVDVRLEFPYNGYTLKITQRKPLIKYAGVIGYEYELKNLTEDNTYG